MEQTGKDKKMPQKAANLKVAAGTVGESSDLNRSEPDSIADERKINPESLLVKEEITDLLSNMDIVGAVKKFKADSEEKKIAVEYTNSYIQFLIQIVESDYRKGVARADAEIRDMVSYVNVMLRKRDEYLFTTLVMHSPSHYRNIQKRFYAKIKKQKEDKENKK